MWPTGADAGFRVRGGASGASRISARGVLKVRPHTKSGGGGGGGGTSGPIYEKWGGRGLQVRYTKSGGALQVQYTKSGGGGGASDTFGHTENIYMYLPTCYFTRARE